MKKGQLFSLPFIYIFGVIVAALIIIFGYGAISRLTNTVNEASLAKSVESLRDIVDFYYTLEPGSKKQFKFKDAIKIPNQIKAVCFVKPKALINAQVPDEAIRTLIQTTKHNVYFLPLNAFRTTRFRVEYLEPIKNPLCINTPGLLSFTLETKATEEEIYVEIS
jgi:hypothetical protein